MGKIISMKMVKLHCVRQSVGTEFGSPYVLKRILLWIYINTSRYGFAYIKFHKAEEGDADTSQDGGTIEHSES